MRGTFLTKSLFATVFGTACAITVLSAVPANADLVTPTITTTPQPAWAFFGYVIGDQATVSGGLNPTGTVTFNLYDNPNATGTGLFTDTVGLSGASAISAGYIPSALGTDYWVATYNGDSNNNPVTTGTADAPVFISSALPVIGSAVAAPEPPSLALLAAGLAFLVMVLRTRRALS